ncbi:MAG TPA: HD domain-containing phosphohydrolase [Spirochaetia bacterium]|nr:HD domain-containing phosphohydrolase [Spirochaetia bacterium]
MSPDRHTHDNAPFPVYVVNGDQRVVYANRALRDALGVSEGDLMGAKCDDALRLFEWCHDPAKCLFKESFLRHDQLKGLPVPARFPGSSVGEYLLWTSWEEGGEGTYLLVWLIPLRGAGRHPSAGVEVCPKGQESAKRLAELTAINRITSQIARAQDLQEVLRLTLMEVIRVLGGSKGVIYLREGDRFLLKEKYGVSADFAAHPKIFSRDAVEWGKEPIICDVASQRSKAEGIHSWISVSLLAMDRATGLIIVTSNRERQFSHPQMQFIETIATDVGMAVANAELLEKVRHLSVRDSLTGLFNRLKFEEALKELAACDEPVSVSVIDLDGLKLVNDTLGHARGDEMIKAAAGVISASCRPGDFVARVGGDEFAMILPGTDAEAAERVCQAICDNVESFNRGGPTLHLSISLGSATCRSGDLPLEVTVKAADAAMYRNKLAKTADKRCSLLSILNAVLAEKGYMTNAHAHKLSRLAHLFGEAVGLPSEQGRDLELLAVARDVGKVGVPDFVLLKPGPLTVEERSLMEKHCEIGHKIAKSAAELETIAQFILHHHERWDGCGYPQGLKGEEIPLVCRLLAIIDAYDAMTSERPYRRALTHDEAVAELKRCAGSQFDPTMVETFLNNVAPGSEER